MKLTKYLKKLWQKKRDNAFSIHLSLPLWFILDYSLNLLRALACLLMVLILLLLPTLIKLYLQKNLNFNHYYFQWINTSSTITKNPYILIVDDEKDILELFSEYLTAYGLKTVCFDNPIKALEYLIGNFGNCSLVITDHKMPQMSGLDFIKKVRKFYNNYIIKIMLISAYIINTILIDKNYK